MKLTEEKVQGIILEETKMVLAERSAVARWAFNFLGVMRNTRAWLQLMEKSKGIKALDAAIESMKVGKYTRAARVIEDLVQDGKLDPDYAVVFKTFINEAGATAAREMDSVEAIVERVEVFEEIMGAAKVIDSMDQPGIVALMKRAQEITKKLRASRQVPQQQVGPMLNALTEVAPEAAEAVETVVRTGGTATVPVGRHWMSLEGTYFKLFGAAAAMALVSLLVITVTGSGDVEMKAGDEEPQPQPQRKSHPRPGQQ